MKLHMGYINRISKREFLETAGQDGVSILGETDEDLRLD